MLAELLLEILKERDCFEGLGMEMKIILKQITVLRCKVRGYGFHLSGSCEHSNEPTSSMNHREFHLL
jgi:hypothetical protein